MQLLSLTLPTPAENLALDEALLEEAEVAENPRETLRLWESPQPTVVIGRASRIHEEVDLPACEKAGVPVLRRCSGGCAVVLGAGCLLFSVVLSYERRPHLVVIDEAHRFVLQAIQRALAGAVGDIVFAGTSDLTWRGRKFSGNSLRCKRRHLLYHGTILYDFDLSMIGRYLRTPPREPSYRGGRAHEDFVTNFPVPREYLWEQLPRAFGATTLRTDLPADRLEALLAEKYRCESWHRER